MKRVLAAVAMTIVSLLLVRSQTQIIGEDCACERKLVWDSTSGGEGGGSVILLGNVSGLSIDVLPRRWIRKS